MSMRSEPLPVYDPDFPAISQNDSWSCAPTTTRWMLYSVGRSPSERWIETTMIAENVANPSVGCTDKSGAGLADFVSRHYGFATGHDGYVATFDELAALAGLRPYGISGGAWYHWSGLRGFDGERLLLANPASGYMGVTQTMDRDQFAALGPWSYFWIEAVRAGSAPPSPSSELDYAPWYGAIGTGLLEMMRADHVLPAQDTSTWLPLGRPVAQIEEAIAENGTVYRWILARNTGFRYEPIP
jgi:hypothetical protein